MVRSYYDWEITDPKWGRYCIPLTDSERPIVAAEELFFNECNTGNGEIVCHCNSTGF